MNMRTAEEIKKGLECCILETDDTSLVDHCKACPYQPTGLCFRTLLKDALAYIQQLEAAHRTEYCEEADYDCKALGEARKRIAELEAIDAEPVVRCNICKYYETDVGFCNYHGHGMDWDGYCSCGAKMDLEVQDE